MISFRKCFPGKCQAYARHMNLDGICLAYDRHMPGLTFLGILDVCTVMY
jgi:hypothetical protein